MQFLNNRVRTFNAPVAFALKPFFVLITLALTYGANAADNTVTLDNIPVTGNPLGVASDELVVPVSVLNGRELSLKREATIGDTLDGIPGVSASKFGPNASRPVIRGLDAERVRIMQNGTSVIDASSLSFDHAVNIDPLIIEQIDVVRGPAALLYGGSAVGGVVNAIDHRIPKESLNGVTGRGEMRFGGPDNTRNGAAVVDFGNGQFAVHVDVFGRKTDDLEIPGFAVSTQKNQLDGTPRENNGRLINSNAQSDGGALGVAFTLDNGYIGASYSLLNNQYGVVAEPDVRIDMESKRWDIAGELNNLGHFIDRVKVKLAHTDYQHQELEDGDVGTTFKNNGYVGSIELGHTPFGLVKGVVGYQFSDTDFEALGDEAFVPNTSTLEHAVYVYEELPFNNATSGLTHKLTFGGRLGYTQVNAKDNPNFGPSQSNRFNPNSFAVGGLYQLNSNWSLTANLSHNERAPSYFELYADGEHVATAQYEVGNSNLNKEISNGLDAQLRWKAGKNQFSLGAYYTKFNNFIGLFNSGTVDIGSGLPISQFVAVPATFKGLEAEGHWQATDYLGVNMRADYVHANDDRNNTYLPRISPARIGAGVNYQQGAFNARLDLLHAFSQNKTAPNELSTNGYNNLSAILAYKLPTKYNLELFARANNLLDEEIRDHTSFLKEISMAGSRSVLVGLRGDF